MTTNSPINSPEKNTPAENPAPDAQPLHANGKDFTVKCRGWTAMDFAESALVIVTGILAGLIVRHFWLQHDYLLGGAVAYIAITPTFLRR